jgi:hypothetical protein
MTRRRRRFRPHAGRLLGQVIGWLCLVAGTLDAITHHP